MYAPEHEAAWKRIVDFVHAETHAKICCQLGHSGAKGSTQLGWEEMDAPLADGNWPLLAASDVPWSPRNQHPKAMDRADMDRVREEFVAAARMADRAGFDMLELHCAHGYLLSSFITPLTNRRTDEYGGSLENRMRYPLEIFAAVRAVWPAGKPISVRISANDWVGADGIEPDDAVEIARLLQEAGVDICDVSAGQTSIRGAAGLRPHVPDAVLRPHPQRDRHGDHGGRQHLRARPRQLDPDGRSRRPRVPRAPASRRSLLDAACRGAARRQGRSLARALLRRPRSTPPPRRAGRGGGDGGAGMSTLAGRHALVTGGGTGIGAAIAHGAGAGRRGRHHLRPPYRAAARDRGRRTEHLARWRPTSPAKRPWRSSTSRAEGLGGPFDIVVANAGMAESAPASKTSLELWNKTIDVNLTGAFLTVKPALAAMRARGWGRIVFIASTAGLKGYAYVAPYVAAKHGVIGLMRALALETASAGITVNAVCPGFTETAMLSETVERIVADDRTQRCRRARHACGEQSAGPVHPPAGGRRRRAVALRRRERGDHRPGDLGVGRRDVVSAPLSPARRDSDSKARLRLWIRLLRVTRLVEGETRERFKTEFNVTLPRFDVMAALYRKPDGMLMSEISRFLLVSNGNVTGIVDRLVSDGFVVRSQRDGDRRTSFVRLTAKGRAAFADMSAAHESWIDRLLGDISAREAEQLSSKLKAFQSEWESET